MAPTQIWRDDPDQIRAERVASLQVVAGPLQDGRAIPLHYRRQQGPEQHPQRPPSRSPYQQPPRQSAIQHHRRRTRMVD